MFVLCLLFAFPLFRILSHFFFTFEFLWSVGFPCLRPAAFLSLALSCFLFEMALAQFLANLAGRAYSPFLMSTLALPARRLRRAWSYVVVVVVAVLFSPLFSL
eukprot:m.78083 g.78083  ORF g.78083 m.78083 type:complete len:103 (-) comp8154_c0_seq2:351-659(-)